MNASAVLKAEKPQPMLGATVIATFEVRHLDAKGRSDIVVSDAGKELARVRVDFGMLR